MDKIVKIGNCEKIEKSIASALSISQMDAKKVFEYLETSYKENTEEFGRIYLDTDLEKGLVVGGGQYYINLPKSIAMLVALVLDITLTKGAVSAVCGLLGIQTQVFYNMNQHKGYACLLREYMRNKIVDSERYLCLAGKECVNNDIECIYRDSENRCCIQAKDIEKIIEYFKEIKIIE